MPSGRVDPPLIRFHNCRVVQFQTPLVGGFVSPNFDELWIRSGRVVDPQIVFYHEQRRPDVNIDCKGAIVAPGLIDLQINGGWGVDFSNMEGDPAAGLRIVAKNLLRHGVTSFCPTLVSSPPNAYRHILPFMSRSRGSQDNGASILGAHLEGPFISSSKHGAHDPDKVCSPSDGIHSLYAMYGEDILVKNAAIVTMAPELPGALPSIEWLSKNGILVSLGHSSATIAEGEKGIRAGARFVTHLFNAMLPFHHRDPGLVGLLAMETPTIENPSSGIEVADENLIHFGIIADGVHTHSAALRLAQRVAPRSICLVSDQVIAAGLPDGRHNWPGLGFEIEVHGRRAALANHPETLCGAVIPLDECVRTFKKEIACTIDFALSAASKHPASALRLLENGQCGTLSVGAVADLILVDPENFNVKSTYLAGECVYSV